MTWVSRLVGKLMMLMAPKGHFLGQIPQPIHRRSDMKAILDSGVTSIQSLPVLTTGHDFLHSCRHFFGLHLSLLTIAIRVNLSDILLIRVLFYATSWCIVDRKQLENSQKMNHTVRNGQSGIGGIGSLPAIRVVAGFTTEISTVNC